MSEEFIVEQAQQIDTEFLIYTGNFCGYCTAAKRLLERHELSFTDYNFDEIPNLRQKIVEATGHRTVPVIFDIKGEQPVFIGGYDQLQPYLRQRS
jgi:glutaredoxin 3|tara:strand:+ start:271 stop:555 length:285 start_codon:yes stop_codon:yes gene_type:complete